MRGIHIGIPRTRETNIAWYEYLENIVINETVNESNSRFIS